MVKFKTDFDYFWSLIHKKENFTFARYADGEVLLMKGLGVGSGTQASNIDKWTAPNHLTTVGTQLLHSLNHIEPNYYYAISGKNDNLEDYNFLRSRIQQSEDKLSFVNLWINSNYTWMKSKLSSIDRDVVLICNENAKPENFPFKVVEHFKFKDDCINYWEKHGEEYLRNLVHNTQKYKDTLFLISCGPVSEIIIHHLYTLNPNNTYIDVGSSIDEFVHGKITRPYMNPNSYYASLISTF